MKVLKLLTFILGLLSFGQCISMSNGSGNDLSKRFYKPLCEKSCEKIKINKLKKILSDSSLSCKVTDKNKESNFKKIELKDEEIVELKSSKSLAACIMSGEKVDFFEEIIECFLMKKKIEDNLIHSVLISEFFHTKEERKNFLVMVLDLLTNHYNKEGKLELLNKSFLVDLHYDVESLMTPIELAFLSEDLDIVKLLLNAGADIFKTNASGKELVTILMEMDFEEQKDKEKKLELLAVILSGDAFKNLSSDRKISILNAEYSS